MPAAFTATRTSPRPACGSGRSSTFRTSGPPYSVMTSARTRGSGREALSGPGLALGGFLVAVLRRRVRHERGEQVLRRVRDLVYRAVERLGVGLRRLVGSADLADVLERRGLDLVLVRRRLEIVECS